jgi:hypothetical protein
MTMKMDKMLRVIRVDEAKQIIAGDCKECAKKMRLAIRDNKKVIISMIDYHVRGIKY